MFSTKKLFAQIPCPLGTECELKQCGFNHDKKAAAVSAKAHDSLLNKPKSITSAIQPPAKKRKIEKDSERDATVSLTSGKPADTGVNGATPASSRQDRPRTLPTKPITPPPGRAASSKLQETSRKLPGRPSSGVSDPVPAPSSRSAPGVPAARNVSKTPVKAEALMPRTMAQPPVQFSVRFQLLKLIHEQFVRLDKEIKASKDPDREALGLSAQELITEALNEEEKAAKENPKVYSNVLKLRIVALKKMKLDNWKEERLKQIARDHPHLSKPPKAASKRVDTGLSPAEELALLPNLLTPIDELGAHGYVATPPTQSEIDEARKIVESAGGNEVCDRCQSRFQVFPGRREDGVLTTNGPCVYHWGRKRRSPKQEGRTVPRVDMWTCCREDVGSRGCTESETHVFKISDPERLALVMPFDETKRKGPTPPRNAVAFDCEMGYTSMGLELIRLTATSWPSGDELVDVLVRPLGEILDLNTRFSGVRKEDFSNAIPYPEADADAGTQNNNQKRKIDTDGDVDSKPQLHVVSSPHHARSLLLKHLTLTTPLIGHAIDNDLNATRLCHPTIVDTALLFPHDLGLPYRNGLKALCKRHLDLDIQMAGDQGHDSKEDSRATGELVRFAVGRKWREMLKMGWKVKEGVFVPPEPKR